MKQFFLYFKFDFFQKLLILFIINQKIRKFTFPRLLTEFSVYFSETVIRYRNVSQSQFLVYLTWDMGFPAIVPGVSYFRHGFPSLSSWSILLGTWVSQSQFLVYLTWDGFPSPSSWCILLGTWVSQRQFQVYLTWDMGFPWCTSI